MYSTVSYSFKSTGKTRFQFTLNRPFIIIILKRKKQESFNVGSRLTTLSSTILGTGAKMGVNEKLTIQP